MDLLHALIASHSPREFQQLHTYNTIRFSIDKEFRTILEFSRTILRKRTKIYFVKPTFPDVDTMHPDSSASLSPLANQPLRLYAIRHILHTGYSRDFDVCSLRAPLQPFSVRSFFFFSFECVELHNSRLVIKNGHLI